MTRHALELAIQLSGAIIGAWWATVIYGLIFRDRGEPA